MKSLWRAGVERSQQPWWLIGGIGVVAVLVFAIASTRGGQPEGPKFDTAVLLAGARAASPFELRYPATVPDGLTLLNVMWGGADLDEDPGSTDFYVDYWFVDPNGIRLHVWQTNLDDLGAEDPGLRTDGVVELIGGDPWIYLAPSGEDAYQVFQLSRRFPDGVLVTIDYYTDKPILREMASSLVTPEQ